MLSLLTLSALSYYDMKLLTYENTSTVIEYFYNGRQISPWHDVPFEAGVADDGTPLLSFLCEIPRHTRPKNEIHKSLPFNPVKQDEKKGKLRYYVYSPSIVNYGAITQTWEDPTHPDEDTGYGGDNDPIDVLQLNEEPCDVGAVHRVRVLGGLALVDDDETDWKLLVVNVDSTDPVKSKWKTLADVPKERVDEVREWFRNYKTAEGKGLNKFGLDERAVDEKHALKTAQGTHELWKKLVDGKVTCEFNKDKCWVEKKSVPHDEL